VAEWIVMPPADQRAFPEVHHRHPNGTMIAVRGHTPEIVQELHGTPMARWTFRCPCGSTYVLERPR
jgi:hypothetical protein